MNTKFVNILKVLIGLIAVVTAYFFVRIISTGDEAIVAGQGQLGIVGPFVQFAKVLLILVALTSILFSLISLFKKPEALKKTAIGLVFLLVLLAISYGIAPDNQVTDVTGQVIEGGEAGAPSKWVSTGIYYTLLLGAIAISAIVIGGVKKVFK